MKEINKSKIYMELLDENNKEIGRIIMLSEQEWRFSSQYDVAAILPTRKTALLYAEESLDQKFKIKK